jgi:hypothetical protein
MALGIAAACVSLLSEAVAVGTEAVVALAVGVAGMVMTGTDGGAEALLLAASASGTTTELDEEAAAQPAVPQASSAVKARPGHLTDRARILARLIGFPGAGTSGDVA